MLVNGKIMYKMVVEWKYGMMVLLMMGSIKMVLKMDKVCLNGLMDLCILDK